MQNSANKQSTLFRSFRFYPAERRVFAKKEPLMPSQWAEKYRAVPIGAHKGAWRNDISPHLVKIMDTWAQPHVREVILCKSPQTGGSEAMFNCMSYAMDRDPSTMMLIMPSEATAKKVNADRIIPTITESLRLQTLISPNPDDIAKMRIKLQNGALLYMAWANSASALASFPVKYLFFDETDKYPPVVGKETDPITLGEKRATTYRYTHKIFKVSTPTREDGPIWTARQRADAQYKYHVQCPGCGESHIMTIDNLKWPEDAAPSDILRDGLAWYQCPHCQAHWTDIAKQKAVRAGKWRRDKGKGLLRPRSVAFHLPAWISPDISLSEIAATYILAKTDRAKLIDFYNGYLAEPYVETIGGDVVAEDALYQRRYQYWPDDSKWRVPMRACLLTCAVDVQTSPPRLECEVIAWGEGYESWGIEYRVLPGDPAGEEVWQALDEYLNREWTHEGGIKMKISGCGIDTGGHYARHVYRYCRKRRRAFALKGSNMRGKPLITASAVKTTLKNKVQLWIVGTETAKDTLYDWMQREAPGAGYMHYHTGYDYSYFRMLTNEVGVIEYDKGGRPYRTWKKKSSDARTEALDIRVYNLAALEILNPDFKGSAESLNKNIKALTHPVTEEPDSKPKKSFSQRPRRGGWVKGWK
jgi:phage terminase large subunit GpA-like protein